MSIRFIWTKNAGDLSVLEKKEIRRISSKEEEEGLIDIAPKMYADEPCGDDVYGGSAAMNYVVIMGGGDNCVDDNGKGAGKKALLFNPQHILLFLDMHMRSI